jgi:hypothetical protein
MKATLILILILLQTSTFAMDNQTILYIGDSHSFGKFGVVMETFLSSKSSNVSMMASCGSTAKTWLGLAGNQKTVCGFWKKDNLGEIRQKEFVNPLFEDELVKVQAQLTIVQLGTNMAVGKNPHQHADSIRKLIRLIKKERSQCLWIGPPDAYSKVVTTQNLKIVSKTIAKIASEEECIYIDSLKLTSFPRINKEGIHYPNKISQEWAYKVIELFPKDLLGEPLK